MTSTARISEGLDQTAAFLKRGIEVMWYAVVVVALVCLVGLIVAGTYGILHNGNDFDGVNLGNGRGVEGDLIVLSGLL